MFFLLLGTGQYIEYVPCVGVLSRRGIRPNSGRPGSTIRVSMLIYADKCRSAYRGWSNPIKLGSNCAKSAQK